MSTPETQFVESTSLCDPELLGRLVKHEDPWAAASAPMEAKTENWSLLLASSPGD